MQFKSSFPNPLIGKQRAVDASTSDGGKVSLVDGHVHFTSGNDILAEKGKIEVAVNKEAESIDNDRTIWMALLMSHTAETGITKLAKPLKERNGHAKKQIQ